MKSELPTQRKSGRAESVYDGPFDPSHGYTLESLLEITPPEEPTGYADTWHHWRNTAIKVKPRPFIKDTGNDIKGWRVFDLSYESTDQTSIGGWLLLPKSGIIKRGFVVGHGYGGRVGPDEDLPFPDAAILFPCARGLSRSHHPHISCEVNWHVIHDINRWDRYVFRGCIEDTWLAISALLRLFPNLEGHLGYLGISFGGGIGAMALAWEDRIERAHLNVPSFGHNPLRMQLPSDGSMNSVQRFERRHPGVATKTLSWYDAATAARHISIPMHLACALADPSVAPAGQFAIYNAIPSEKELFVLEAGHLDYPNREKQESELLQELETFFADL